MAIAETPTKLPLTRWARIMGINPLHFEGVQIQALQNNGPSCAGAWFQHDWQDHDHCSREQVAAAIAEAESEIEDYIGSRLLPSWETDEWANSTRPYRSEEINLSGRNVPGLMASVNTRWRHVISGGVRAVTLIDAAATIVYSDADSDGYFETATIVATVAAGTACEIRAFYPGHAGDPAWEIRPITVVLASGTATITCKREQLVLPDRLEMLVPDGPAADGLDDDYFLETVAVARVWNDPQTQVSFLWEPAGGCSCGVTPCDLSSYTTQTGNLIPRNADLGIVAYAPGDWDAATDGFTQTSYAVSRAPEIVRLFYYAGIRDMRLAGYPVTADSRCPTVEMDRSWARIVAIFAASKLDRPPCACIGDQVEDWRTDLAYVGGAEQLSRFRTSAVNLDNPFGTTRGAVFAWQRVSRLGADARAGSLTAVVH